jgi:hypothetical protein
MSCTTAFSTLCATSAKNTARNTLRICLLSHAARDILKRPCCLGLRDLGCALTSGTMRLAVLFTLPAANSLLQTGRFLLELALKLTGILWFARLLVFVGIAHTFIYLREL